MVGRKPYGEREIACAKGRGGRQEQGEEKVQG